MGNFRIGDGLYGQRGSYVIHSLTVILESPIVTVLRFRRGGTMTVWSERRVLEDDAFGWFC